MIVDVLSIGARMNFEGSSFWRGNLRWKNQCFGAGLAVEDFGDYPLNGENLRNDTYDESRTKLRFFQESAAEREEPW